MFSVAWSPLLPNVFASTSDDSTIRVWDVQQGTGISLTGHRDKTRAIAWNSELPHLLFSGSWDSTIRMWDIREKTLLHTATEHHADVYCLSYHPDRPFMYASCSRDTSIRFWTIENALSASFVLISWLPVLVKTLSYLLA